VKRIEGKIVGTFPPTEKTHGGIVLQQSDGKRIKVRLDRNEAMKYLIRYKGRDVVIKIGLQIALQRKPKGA